MSSSRLGAARRRNMREKRKCTGLYSENSADMDAEGDKEIEEMDANPEAEIEVIDDSDIQLKIPIPILITPHPQPRVKEESTRTSISEEPESETDDHDQVSEIGDPESRKNSGSSGISPSGDKRSAPKFFPRSHTIPKVIRDFVSKQIFMDENELDIFRDQSPFDHKMVSNISSRPEDEAFRNDLNEIERLHQLLQEEKESNHFLSKELETSEIKIKSLEKEIEHLKKELRELKEQKPNYHFRS
ncbi:uncharacterized protein LOC135926127 isoform X2 [Gordionus sp. m RMFG-2023]|uniref:uncharacterized protein LOC135926127 isoform X2 n=1 Tax=Gordionus sp. m RMFG-2023 TaxID=3053472 RepID=UPI0031FC423D